MGQGEVNRLAQRPGSYVILKYVRSVIKQDGVLISVPAPLKYAVSFRTDEYRICKRFNTRRIFQQCFRCNCFGL